MKHNARRDGAVFLIVMAALGASAALLMQWMMGGFR